MIHIPLLVTAHLASPLAGDPPQLDALLEWSNSPFFLSDEKRQEPGFKLTRAGPAPPQGQIQIPLAQTWLGEWLVSCCSNPVLPSLRVPETVEHVCKRLATEASGLLAENERRIVSTTNAWTKSYRLPLRVRQVPLVRWACLGNRREILKAMRDVRAIGKKIADGYGRVAKWEAVEAEADWSWWAPHSSGNVLMRTLPLLVNGREWLPKDMLGARRDYMACRPPYWHPERRCEVMAPC